MRSPPTQMEIGRKKKIINCGMAKSARLRKQLCTCDHAMIVTLCSILICHYFTDSSCMICQNFSSTALAKRFERRYFFV
ncbi:MAG: hypothetical protein QM498_09005 [Desulfobacterium sp.]